MMVLVGFDDATQEFIVNDPADHTTGLDYRYKYATILDTLRDFDHATHKVIDEPTVLFTAPKKLIQVKGKSAIYWVENNIKYYISHPQVFKNHRWSWGLVEKVDQSLFGRLNPWLYNFQINKLRDRPPATLRVAMRAGLMVPTQI